MEKNKSAPSPKTCGRGIHFIRIEKVADSKISGYVWTGSFKVAEHGFKVLMPINYLYFGASFLQESRLTTEVTILTF